MNDPTGHRTKPEPSAGRADDAEQAPVTIGDLTRCAETFADLADPKLMQQAWDQPGGGDLEDLPEPLPLPAEEEAASEVLERLRRHER